MTLALLGLRPAHEGVDPEADRAIEALLDQAAVALPQPPGAAARHAVITRRFLPIVPADP